MVDELRQVIEEMQQQTEATQRDLAQRIHAWLEEERDEQEWDAIIQSPKGQDTLRKLVAQAREEIARGEVEEGGFGS